MKSLVRRKQICEDRADLTIALGGLRCSLVDAGGARPPAARSPQAPIRNRKSTVAPSSVERLFSTSRPRDLFFVFRLTGLALSGLDRKRHRRAGRNCRLRLALQGIFT